MRHPVVALLTAMTLTPMMAHAQKMAPMPTGTMLAPLQTALTARYGTHQMRTSVDGSTRMHKLTVILKDARFHGLKGGSAADTALVVAKFAAATLPVDYQPDSVAVQIVTSDLGVSKTTIERAFALKALR